jgi:(Z)-2-((N-methylformamido)methylene)-5-hydroxybutyrolactone dehydrogenase
MALPEFHLYINGEQRRGRAGYEETINPYTGKAWAKIAQASTEDVEDALSAAEAASDSFGKLPGLQRAALLHRLADLIEEEADTLSQIETTDNGKMRRETKAQMLFAARNYRFFAGLADKMNGEVKPMDSPSLFDYTTREPYGVCALITPWNSPISVLTNKLPACLAAGNTCVVKPSEFTSASTMHFATLVEKAGFPAGVFNVVAGKAAIGQALVNSPIVSLVSFTGSVGVGRMIAKQAAENIVPVVLELGGKSANIILDDAELERAISGSVAGIFAASGQSCIAGSRLLVHEKVYDQVVQGILERMKHTRFGDPADLGTDIGPVVNKQQWETIHRHVAQAQEDGAKLILGGREESERLGGLFVAPTVFTDLDPKSRLAHNEVFGPVLTIFKFKTDDEAVKIANATKFGLAAGLWTTSLRRAHQIAGRLHAGQIWVNTYRQSSATAPFGGFGHSGYGKERGTEAMLEYTRLKNVMMELGAESRDPFSIKLS